MSGAPWNDKTDALNGDKDIALLASRYSVNSLSLQFAPTSGNLGISDLASKSLSNVSISSVMTQLTFAFSSGMLVSSVEILALSTVICSSEIT